MPLTPGTVNDQDFAGRRTVPEAHNRGLLPGVIRNYLGDNTNSQTFTLAPPARRIFEVRVFDTAAANYQNPWIVLKKVAALAGEARGYTYTEATAAILFGNGTDGYKPANGALVQIEYETKYVGESTTAPGYQRIQDGDGTTLADVAAARKFTMYAGVVTAYDGAGPVTLTDSNAAWTVNEYATMTVVITEGTGRGQSKVINSNTATVLTLASAFGTAPDATSSYAIITSLNALAVLLQAGLKVDQVNVEGFAAGEYRSTLPTLANLQNSQLQLAVQGMLLMSEVPLHGSGANANTWNADGTIATEAWTVNSKTFTRTYTWAADGTLTSSAMAVS